MNAVMAAVGIASVALTCFAYVHASRENRAHTRAHRWARVIVFDAWRALGLASTGWVFGCALHLVEAHAGLILWEELIPWPAPFVASAIFGVGAFQWFGWELRHGRHRWQRYRQAVPTTGGAVG
jgi:hypothetical protein